MTNWFALKPLIAPLLRTRVNCAVLSLKLAGAAPSKRIVTGLSEVALRLSEVAVTVS